VVVVVIIVMIAGSYCVVVLVGIVGRPTGITAADSNSSTRRRKRVKLYIDDIYSN